MDTVKSHGVCIFCNKEFSKSSISRHLGTHLSQKAAEGQPGKSFHVKVESDSRHRSSPYFLNLWVNGDANMYEIDGFLRGIWLECCGHMSAFTNPKQSRRGGWSVFDEDEEETDEDEFMETEAGNALSKGMALKYDYDFGSTTSLLLTVMGEYPVAATDTIVLLSRNGPLEIMCEICGTEPAVKMCTVCWNTPNTFCKKCAKKHAKECGDFAEYASAPVVNSPRIGVCAYTGGSIDKERDGVYVKK